MAVHDEMRIPCRGLEAFDVVERGAARHDRRCRGVMDCEDVEVPVRSSGEPLVESIALALAQFAARHEYRGRQAGIEAVHFHAIHGEPRWEAGPMCRLFVGKRTRPAMLTDSCRFCRFCRRFRRCREGVEAQVVAPMRLHCRPGVRAVKIVIARHHKDAFRCAERAQPVRRFLDFGSQPEVNQVTGDDDDIRVERKRPRTEFVQGRSQVPMASAIAPGSVPEPAFTDKVPGGNSLEARQMRV